MSVYCLTDELVFPDLANAEPSGLVAIGGDLSVERLLLAYRSGIFPWYLEGEPILWFSPDPRCVLYLDNYTPGRSFMKVIKSGKFQVRFDTNFDLVIKKCSKIARKEQSGTWITPDMIDSYNELHEGGYAHSVETYLENNIVGGLYGVSLGSAFFGESMFHSVDNASKVAFYFLVQRCKEWNFDFIDSQVTTEHMMNLGSVNIDRKRFLSELERSLKHRTRRGKWHSS